jgi:hypothetical protein
MDTPLIRTSERATFKRCRQKWWWGHVQGLRLERQTKPALVFGDLFHQSLAAYYKPGVKRGPHPSKTFEKLYMQYIDEQGKLKIADMDNEDERVDLGELGIEVLNNYISQYGKDEDIEIIYPEHPFRVQLKDLGGKPFWYIGRFDALFKWRTTGEKGLLEHKTGSEDLKPHLQLDEQAGSYWTFAPMHLRKLGIMESGEELDIILYNFARKAKKDLRPQNEEGLYLNKDGSVSKKQPPPLFERIAVYRDPDDRKEQMRRIRAEAFEMRLVKQGKLPVYKNPTKNCTWDCVFMNMCELHETSSDWESYRDQMFVVGDPYEDYRKDLFDGKS